MDRSLTVAIANVESMVRQILAASQALMVQVDALLGISHATTPSLLPTSAVETLHDHAAHFVVSVEACWTDLVSSRFRLRDWVAWMRATGSAIKARGTAANSAQRDNAQKRRLSDATQQRILEYLRQAMVQNDKDAGSNVCPSDWAMGLTASRYWDSSRETVRFGHEDGSPVIRTLQYALSLTANAAKNAFDQPRFFIEQKGTSIRKLA